jgi:hypothetical protein
MKQGISYLLLMFFFVLACGGTANVSEENVRVTGIPQYVCPSSTPRPTDTQVPTRTQMPTATQVSISTPMVYATNPPTCNYAAGLSYQYVCIPNACIASSYSTCGYYYSYPLATANPPGFWYGGGIGYGPTATPRATHTPYPTRTPYPSPTPYVVSENYPMGADVYVGGTGGLELRFQVSNPQIQAVPQGNSSTPRQVVVWQVEIENVGQIVYNALPGAQVFVSHLLQNGQLLEGYWYASSEAAMALGIALDPLVLDIVEVQPNETVSFTLTAFTPIGELFKIGWLLDPYSGGTGNGVVGGNTALWINQVDPNNCLGNVGDDFSIPTPSGIPPSVTPSVTPYIPPYAGATP